MLSAVPVRPRRALLRAPVSAEGALGIIPRHSITRPRPLLQLLASKENVPAEAANAAAPPEKPVLRAPAAPADQQGARTPAQRQRLLMRRVEAAYAALLQLQDREDENVRRALGDPRGRDFSALAAELENELEPGAAAPARPSEAKYGQRLRKRAELAQEWEANATLRVFARVGAPASGRRRRWRSFSSRSCGPCWAAPASPPMRTRPRAPGRGDRGA